MLIGLQNVTFEFGSRIIVSNATWHIQPGERIGLVGYNGTGKSTLLKVLVGEYQPSVGAVERGKEVTIGYLHQDLLSFDTNDSILEVALNAFEKARQLQKEIEELGTILEQTSDEEMLHLYTEKLHELDILDAYNIEHKTAEVLHGLGFQQSDLHRSYKEFSGGWRMRVLLAKMILQQPDVLLLDEPTNHLDMPSIEWLEKYLQRYKGSVVVVSHDKYFLNRMVTKIIELYQKELHVYNGNYDFFEREKVERVALQQRAYENQQTYIQQQERFIERFKAKASKAAQAQSIVKRLDKLERLEEASIEQRDIRIQFQIEKQPGKIICELKHITKKFGENTIVENAHAEINREDKIALVGANGKGKSTVLRIIAGAEIFDGKRIWGHNIQESFYAQHQLEALNLNNSILQEMKDCGSQQTEQQLRNVLGCFLFGGDDIDKKIKILSGGEKARIALAKTMISKANFLLLDEPTNHLDMNSVELLINALNQYEGSYILVSHDRYFVSKTANKIWEIEDHQIKEYKGPYEEWATWKAQKEKITKEVKPAPTKIIEPVATTPKTAIDKEKNKEIQKQQKLCKQLEEKIATQQQGKAALESLLAHPETYSNKEAFVETEKAYKQAAETLAILNKEYEIAFEKLILLEE